MNRETDKNDKGDKEDDKKARKFKRADYDEEMERLHKSCRRLIWLNPLLRFEGYEPKAQGAQAILPHVDDFRPVHNLESMAELGAVLSRQPTRRLEAAGSYAELMAGRGAA